MSMKNILILTDFSNNSWNSITYALSIFENQSCNFYLLNGLNSYEKNNVNITDSQQRNFDALLKKLNTEPLKGSHTFTQIKENTDIIEAARTQIKEQKIDLLIIGTNGMSSNGRKNNISPIAEDIITKLKCSILVVPFEARFNGIHKIAFPTDYTDFSEAKLLQNITPLLSFHKSATSFVYMAKKSNKLNKEQRWNKETLQDYFANQPHNFHAEINENFELSIENFIDKNNIDLIVMAAKNLNLFEQILFRPQSKDISYYFKTPFLVLHKFKN